MRGTGRILFNWLTVLSLVLAIGAATLWGRSRFAVDVVVHRGSDSWSGEIAANTVQSR